MIQVMQAIWEGDMTDLSDIIELDMLLENIFTWAMCVFKPHVAMCLNQWKYHHPEEDTIKSTASTEASDNGLHEHQTRHTSTETTAEIESKHILEYKLPALEREKIFQDVDKMVEQRIQELIKEFGLTPSGLAADTLKESATDSANKSSDSTSHVHDGIETQREPKPQRATLVDSVANDRHAESEQSCALPTDSSSGVASLVAPTVAIPVIHAPRSYTRSETRRPRNRAASASPNAKNRVMLPHRRPRSVSSTGIAPRLAPSTDHSVAADWSPLSVRHLLPRAPTRTPRRPVSADGSLRSTDAAGMRQTLWPDNRLDSSLRVPTADLFGLADARNLEDSQDSAHTVRHAVNKRQGMSSNRGTTNEHTAEDVSITGY